MRALKIYLVLTIFSGLNAQVVSEHLYHGPSSLSMAGSDIDPRTYNWSDYIWVYDNEPRNREIVNRIESTIDRGDKVVIWPSGIDDKDINDMFNSGIDPQSVIESNIYQGLQAKLKLNNWKKI